jgi:hypothetical protein
VLGRFRNPGSVCKLSAFGYITPLFVAVTGYLSGTATLTGH